MLQREWQGRVVDIPKQFGVRKIPAGCEFVIIYSDGSRTYHNGLNPSSDRIKEISRVMSRCWDSLPDETKQELNSRQI